MIGERRAPRRKVLMTVDAAGGVWRYALDLAAGLRPLGYDTIFACFGPAPNAVQTAEAEAAGKLLRCDAPLDWMVEDAASLAHVPDIIARLAASEGADLIHLNLPSQAAGLQVPLPVLVTAHSCVSTWFQSVRGHPAPEPWAWQWSLNRCGFDRADAVVMPSRSHATLSREVYGPIDNLHVVHNATRTRRQTPQKIDKVFAAGRWWDDGKNGAALDGAAPTIVWPVQMVGANQGPSGQHVPLRQVQHSGELSHAQTMTLMRDAAIFVSPSLYEPFGLAALEAARSASALVLADISTYREIWEGVALFADPRDPQALAAEINRLIADPALRRQLGEAAQARALQFTPEKQAAAIDAIYQQLLSPAQAPMTVEQA